MSQNVPSIIPVDKFRRQLDERKSTTSANAKVEADEILQQLENRMAREDGSNLKKELTVMTIPNEHSGDLFDIIKRGATLKQIPETEPLHWVMAALEGAGYTVHFKEKPPSQRDQITGADLIMSWR